MMWWAPVLVQVVLPVLLVTHRTPSGTTSSTTFTALKSSPSSEFPTASTTNSQLPSPFPSNDNDRHQQNKKDAMEQFRALYRDLERPGMLHHQVTPTLRFSFVSPPLSNGTSTWRGPHHTHQQHPQAQPDPTKPIAIYLPGLDGYGISAAQHQFDNLAQTFQLWRLTVDATDQSSFAQVVQAVATFVQKYLHVHSLTNEPEQPNIVLVGESCGGVLAAATALRLQQQQGQVRLRGLVLINPATSFDKTAWDSVVPWLATLRHADRKDNNDDNNNNNNNNNVSPYAVLGSLALSAVIPDLDQYRRIFGVVAQQVWPTGAAASSSTPSSNAMATLLDSMRETGHRLPPNVLEHRVRWLASSAALVRQRLHRLYNLPILLVAGQQDRLLPSDTEIQELVEHLVPHAETLRVPNRGHFVLDENVNLTEAILHSKIDPLHWKTTKRPFDIVRDWHRPSDAELRQAIATTASQLRTFHSPVFFSTDATGQRWMGLGQLPRPEGSLLFVGNHQFAAADLRLLVAELYEQRGIVPRGLAHPITFFATKDKPGELGGRTPGLRDDSNPVNGDFQKFGAIEVTPRNYYRVLQAGHDALLFPGGAKEALSGRTDYPLFWPDQKVDFVRTAAKFNVTVIPLSAVGMVDSVTVLAEPQQLLNVPIIGDRFREFNRNVSAARYDEKNDDEVIGFPLALPKTAARNYFVFGKPFSLEDVDHRDKAACERVYREIQAEVRRGLDDVLRARPLDPYYDPVKRLAFERWTGKTAPTFAVKELNANKQDNKK